MNIFITGSNGFVGSALMYFFEEKGYSVIGIDNSSKCNKVSHPNTIIGDIRNEKNYEIFCNTQIDLIIHCAAKKDDFGISDESYFSNNEYGTKILMQFASKKNIKKIIYYSTVSVYGHQDHTCDETAEYLSNTVYGDSKFAGEKEIWKWCEEDKKREVITLRPSVIYGPHNFANMYNLINQMHKFPWFMIGDGSHIKSMVSLKNMIDMTYLAINQLKPGVENFNCIDKPYFTVKQLMEVISSNDGFSMPLIYIPIKIAVLIGKVFDVIGKLLNKELPINSDRMIKFGTSTDYRAEKIREAGYIQNHSIKDEFKRTCEWYLKELQIKKNNK
ncbi:MAG: NAD(P)-dependent oxidoreductase [Candidatus Cloacimonetes bacterium]|nr:NAD(P)-dependent oxidoreductase [Candidatus Cloacimonadota bacterium]